MDDPHLSYVIAAFAVTGVTIAVMIGAVLADYRALRLHLGEAGKALEAARGGRKGPSA